MEMKSPQAKTVRLLQEKYQENLEVMFKNLLKDESLSDVTVHCKDGFVRAHRVILASCSPYFKKIFHEHPEPQVVFLVHGVPVKQMKSLVELMYRGSTDIPSDMMSKLYEIAEDFGIKGIVDENDKSPLNNSGRDTRFKGQKRVAVDFDKEAIDTQIKMHSPKVAKHGTERRTSSCSEKSFKKSTENLLTSSSTNNTSSSSSQNVESITPLVASVKQEPQSLSMSSGLTPGQLSAEARRRNNWAMKQRKYKCVLCPASFKRASHLTRHQLVHTGERPYTCAQCDKAFSRHDKLKHHVRKAHEAPQYDDALDSRDNVYTMGHVEILTPHTELAEVPTRITREDLVARMPPLPPKTPEPVPEKPSTPIPRPILPKAVLSPPPLSTPVVGVAQKKGRGRPRKYPPVPRPLIKRPRGRPRLNHSASVPRPGHKFETSTPLPGRSTENYDITNMPFGDLEYLTKPLTMRESPEHFEDSCSTMDPNLMEPLVEIQLDQNDQNERPEQTVHHTAGSFLQNIGLLETSAVANIGECTISLTPSSGC